MKRYYRYYSFTFLISSVLLILIGLSKQEHLIVFKKAVNICLECIGVG